MTRLTMSCECLHYFHLSYDLPQSKHKRVSVVYAGQEPLRTDTQPSTKKVGSYVTKETPS